MNDQDFIAQIGVSLAWIALAEKKYTDGADLARQSAASVESIPTSFPASIPIPTEASTAPAAR